YEICFVEDIAFYELAAPTYDVVDFAERASRGGDGVGITRGRQRSAAAPPSDAHTGHGGPVGFDGAVIVINSEDHFNSFLFPSSPQDIAPGVVIAEFGASWCKNCRKIAPVIKNLAMQHKFTALVLDVDIDDCEDVATTCQVSSVPRLIAYRGGVKVGDYTGSNPDEVTAFFNEHTRDGDQE
ncbi:TXN, partial [Symbiodinium microadriaticum]